MKTDNVNLLLLRLSCFLSILGSLIVMLVCKTRKILEKQNGRHLIFWLSFSDFSSSFIYLLSSFLIKDNNENTIQCKVFALLGIFFPVASFLWTDFIAYYLYSMIVSRKFKTEKEWSNLMTYFHIISWGLSAFCILIVASFDHAGRSEENGNVDNTGGWCWVMASSKTLILWEIIGGKLIEWMSAFIILPYLYFITARTLVNLDNSWTNFVENNKTGIKKETFYQYSKRNLTSFIDKYLHEVDSSSSEPLLQTNDLYYDDEYSDITSINHNNHKQNSFDEREHIEAQTKSNTTNNTIINGNHNNQKTENGTKNTPKFRKFYTKMALVPVLFFIARIWGSIRIIIYATNSSNDSIQVQSANTWLKSLQAIFDTSQGFLNFILFILLSSENMRLVYEILYNSLIYFYYRFICCQSEQKIKHEFMSSSNNKKSLNSLSKKVFSDSYLNESSFTENNYGYLNIGENNTIRSQDDYNINGSCNLSPTNYNENENENENDGNYNNDRIDSYNDTDNSNQLYNEYSNDSGLDISWNETISYNRMKLDPEEKTIKNSNRIIKCSFVEE